MVLPPMNPVTDKKPHLRPKVFFDPSSLASAWTESHRSVWNDLGG